MDKNYFVITCNEDGDVYIQQMSRERIEADLNESEEEEGGYFGKHILTEIKDMDLQSYHGTFIIEGRLVKPKVVEKITRWSV